MNWAFLSDFWRLGVKVWTGWPVVSIMWLDEIVSLICSLYLTETIVYLSRPVSEICFPCC